MEKKENMDKTDKYMFAYGAILFVYVWKECHRCCYAC